MSLLNVHVDPQRVLIIVDTAGGEAGEGVVSGEISKVLVLPHANIAIACRGSLRFLLEVLASCFLSKDDFDGISGWLGPAMDAAFEQFVASAKAQWPDASEHDVRSIELALAGYSARAGRMEAISFRRSVASDCFAAIRIDPYCIHYGADWTSENPPALDSLTAMRLAARHQVRHALAANPTAIIGGSLVTLELRRDSASFEVQPV